MKVALVAGELSGDLLGAALIEGLRARVPDLQCFGVCGERMRAAGCEPWASIDELSLMGIAEVLPALPRLFRLRGWLIERLLAERPDVVVGIDAPDFNLGLERRLRERGLRTVPSEPHAVAFRVYAPDEADAVSERALQAVERDRIGLPLVWQPADVPGWAWCELTVTAPTLAFGVAEAADLIAGLVEPGSTDR